MRPISDLIGLVLTANKACKDLHHMLCSSQPRIRSSLILTEHETSLYSDPPTYAKEWKGVSELKFGCQ
eukprot:scaffold6279_cov70-Skeletonema_marinoi.AAC.1